jgi:hypothetical protein
MAVQAGPSRTVAELAGIRHQARHMRRAARQALDNAIQAHTKATMQSAAGVRCSPPPGRGRDQPGGSSLAQLLQPLLGAGSAEAGSAVTKEELAVVQPFPTRPSGWDLSESLASIRRQVGDIYRNYRGLQVTRPTHLRLVDPAAPPDT